MSSETARKSSEENSDIFGRKTEFILVAFSFQQQKTEINAVGD